MTPQEIIAELSKMSAGEKKILLGAIGEENVARFIEQTKLRKARESGLPKSALTATVENWEELRKALSAPPPEGETHPAKLFELMLVQIEEDLLAEDAGELFRDLMMLYRAVKRG